MQIGPYSVLAELGRGAGQVVGPELLLRLHHVADRRHHVRTGKDGAGPAELEDARRVLRAALDYCLEGRELMTRVVARAVACKERR